MRYATRRNLGFGVSVVAAAAFGSLMGTPVAKGDLVVSIVSQQTNGLLTDYVLGALNNGLNGTGSALLAGDITISTPSASGALFIDLKADTDGDGTVDANVLDQADLTNGTKKPSFGGANGFLGTFVGVGTTPNATSGATTGSTPFVNQGVWINSQTSINNGGVTGTQADIASTSGPIDPAFKAGTVHALEEVGLFTSATFKGPAANATPANFANIVVPTGTIFTVQGLLGGDQGSKQPFFFTNVIQPTSSISLTGVGIPTNTITLVSGPGNGSYVPQSVAVGTNPTLQVNGFHTADEEIYALTTTDTLAQVQAAITGSNITAQAITPTIAGLFPTATVEIDSNGTGFNPAFLAINGVPVSAIGVVPEPTTIGALVLGGAGLLSRRRRRQA